MSPRRWLLMLCHYRLSLLLLMLAACRHAVLAADDGVRKKCNACRFLVTSFHQGLRATEKAHFGGGNTAWEEKSLGKYARSETRLVEVLDHTCRDKAGKDGDKAADTNLLNFKIDKDTQAQHLCQLLLEEHEESVENWYFHKQSSESDLHTWLCIDTLTLCCPPGTYGPQCEPCPGDVDRPCFGRGQCTGGGTRSGSGACKCDKGYTGKLCRKCAGNYISTQSNDTHVTCEACDPSCRGGCVRPSASDACTACRTGYATTANEPSDGQPASVSCVDVDECAAGENEDGGRPPCEQAANERCVNTAGSYRCDCAAGYKRQGSKCQLDIAAESWSAERPARVLGPLSAEQVLRLASACGMAVSLLVIAARRSWPLAGAACVALALAAYVEWGGGAEWLFGSHAPMDGAPPTDEQLAKLADKYAKRKQDVEL